MGSALSKVVSESTEFNKADVFSTMEKRVELYEDFEHVPGEHRTFQQCSNSCLLSLIESKVPQDSPRSTTVSISTAERWEKELLADAKVAPAFSLLYCLT